MAPRCTGQEQTRSKPISSVEPDGPSQDLSGGLQNWPVATSRFEVTESQSDPSCRAKTGMTALSQWKRRMMEVKGQQATRIFQKPFIWQYVQKPIIRICVRFLKQLRASDLPIRDCNLYILKSSTLPLRPPDAEGTQVEALGRGAQALGVPEGPGAWQLWLP